MRVLIDGDVIVYACGFSAESPIWRVVKGDKTLASFRYKKELDEWAKDMPPDTYQAVKDVHVEPVANALSSAKQLIKRVMLRTGAEEQQIYLTGKGNFREEVATIKPYKGNREQNKKPYHYDSIKKYLMENWGAIEVEGIEADDAMSTAQMEDYKVPDIVEGYYVGTCIATIDKDLDMVPGWHYNWNKDILYSVDEWTAMAWFYSQLIMGDTVDNIQGVPKAGKAKARKVLMDCEDEEDMYWATLDLYCSAYERPMEALIENALLLWMRREEGVNWNPPI